MHFLFVWKDRSFWWDSKWNSPSHWKFASVTIAYHAPCGDTRFISQNYQWKEPFHLVPQRNNCVFHTHCSIWRKIVTGFSTKMESTLWLGHDVTSVRPSIRTQSHNANVPGFVWGKSHRQLRFPKTKRKFEDNKIESIYVTNNRIQNKTTSSGRNKSTV